MRTPNIQPLGQTTPYEAAALLKSVMGDAYGRKKTEALWTWKHQDNPAGTSWGYSAYSPQGELVALRPFMRWSLRSGEGRQIVAARAVDTVVHPAWRRSGLFSRLTTEGIDHLKKEGVELIFNTPNDQSSVGYRKLGWRLLGHPIVWLRLRSFLARKRIDCLRAEEQELVGDLPRFDETWVERLAVFKPRIGPSEAICASKSSEYLRWRYGQHPNLSYHVVEAPDVIGIIRFDRRFGRVGVALVDYWTTSDSVGIFAGLIRAILQKTGGQYLVTGPLPTKNERLGALRHGLIPLPWRNVNFAARPITMSDQVAIFRNRTHWRLTLGDLENF